MIPESHISQPGGRWVTPWFTPWPNDATRLDRYALVWPQGLYAEPHVWHVAVVRDCDGWAAIAWSPTWLPVRVPTLEAAQAEAERYLEEMVS